MSALLAPDSPKTGNPVFQSGALALNPLHICGFELSAVIKLAPFYKDRVMFGDEEAGVMGDILATDSAVLHNKADDIFCFY